MKKILLIAALAASSVMPSSVFAAGVPAAATTAPAKSCYLLPLTADCLAAWKAESDAFWHKVTTATPVAAPKVAVAAPAMPKMPTCTKAAAGAGHMYDCKM